MYRDGVKIASIGDSRYKDYSTYIEENGIVLANNNRALYYKRHKEDIKIKGPNGFLSPILLW